MRILEVAPDYQRVHEMSVDNWKLVRHWQYVHPGRSLSATMRLLPKTVKREIQSGMKLPLFNGRRFKVVCVDGVGGFNYSNVAGGSPKGRPRT